MYDDLTIVFPKSHFIDNLKIFMCCNFFYWFHQTGGMFVNIKVYTEHANFYEISYEIKWIDIIRRKYWIVETSPWP